MIENVLLLTIDSLRADYMPPKTSSSTLSTLQLEGLSFNSAFATGPGTTCSFPGLLTGTLPLSYDGLGPLSEERPRVATHLKSDGLTTAGFHSNPFLSTSFNYDSGFDNFVDYQNPLMGLATSVFPRGIEVNNPKLQTLDEYFNLTSLLKGLYQTISGKSRPYVPANVITNDVINWLDATEDDFFCWAHYMDVHHPCYPPEEIRQKFGVGDVSAEEVSAWYSTALNSPDELSEPVRKKFERLYRAAIVFTDQQIGRIIDHIKSSGKWDDTLIIITSDHGELFGEYGAYGKPIQMYDELLRVPLLIVNGPDYLDEATSDIISLLDVPPLIHDALDQSVPSEYEGQIPGAGPIRSYICAEHQVQDGVVIGSRSETKLYEYSELRDERGFFQIGPKEFEPLSEREGNEQLKRKVKQRVSEKSDESIGKLN